MRSVRSERVRWGGGSNWVSNVFELGLVGAGCTLAARLLGYTNVYLTNYVIGNIAQAYQLTELQPGLFFWLWLGGWKGVVGGFPYGAAVTPP